MPYIIVVFTFVESPLFSRLVREYLDDDEYSRLQQHLDRHPEAGAVIRGTGGVRKLRWAVAGRGKRGGLRIIYFVRRQQATIWLLTMYPKNVVDNIPAHVLRKIREAIDSE